MPNLMLEFKLVSSDLGHISMAVQFGFIIGTLVLSILTIVDRFSPSKVFLLCAILGALLNVGLIWEGNNLSSILVLRFFTGFFLAGIYPVGMKIAADHFDKELGKSLGFLVAALVLGTALPHLIKAIMVGSMWKYVLIITSSLAAFGGLIMQIVVPDGPYLQPAKRIDLSAFFSVFQNRNFRSAAYGYFGHMWELYAFWVFVPKILHTYKTLHPSSAYYIPVLSFEIIAIGGIACLLASHLAQTHGTKKTAMLALLLSCLCCLISPFIFFVEYEIILIGFLLFWGFVVIADSPLFSTLVAQNAPPEIKGTALTIVTCIGFSITIISIELINALIEFTDSIYVYTTLAIGPIFGLIALKVKES